MPNVTVEWFEGRSKEQKARLAKAITDAMTEIGKAPAEATNVIFVDIAKENWAGGGVLHSDK